MNNLSFNQILIIVIITAGLFLAFWVYFSDKKNKANKSFFFFTIFSLAWIIFSFLGNIALQKNMSLIFKRLNFSFLVPSFIAAYFFSIYFPKETKRDFKIDKIIVFVGTIIFFFSALTDLVVKDIEVKEWGTNIIGGSGFIIFNLLVVVITFLIIGNLIKKYFNSFPREKTKIQYFIIGALIYGLANIIFNVFFPIFFETYQYDWLGDYSIIFFLGFTAYAILKKELFGIKIILTALLVGLIAILLLLNTLLFTESLPFQIIKGIIFFIFLFFGHYLIKSVQLEIRRREELENLTSQLETANIKLTSAYRKLESLDKAKSEFVSIASHQLRTPLTIVKGYISMILEKSYGRAPEKMKTPLESIYASNERLIKLVNDLLSVSRIEAGKIELEPEKASIEEIISGVVEELKVIAQKKNIYLKTEFSSKSPPEFLIDKSKIRQVIFNIVDNAIRYTEKGGIKAKLQIAKDKLQIIITDTGEGMTEKELSKLFESFSRGMAGNRLWTEGAGLGLFIARKFVEMHQGKIWAESKGKEKGSTFYIELPIK